MQSHFLIKPKKSLGQNFLVDENISSKIVRLFDCYSNDSVLEIGPGAGAITKHLLATGTNLICVEIDRSAIAVLKQKFSEDDYPKFNILHGDIRNFKPEDVFQQMENSSLPKIKVIGNIPYNISSDILFWVFENSDKLEYAQFMLQKEVAKRLTASTSTKEYGILTVATNLVGKAQILFDIPPSCFYPRPKVTSSVVKIVFKQDKPNYSEFKSTMDLVKSAFNQRRKILRNAMNKYLSEKFAEKTDEFWKAAAVAGFDYSSKRAEELSFLNFLEFHKFVQEEQGKIMIEGNGH